MKMDQNFQDSWYFELYKEPLEVIQAAETLYSWLHKQENFDQITIKKEDIWLSSSTKSWKSMNLEEYLQLQEKPEEFPEILINEITFEGQIRKILHTRSAPELVKFFYFGKILINFEENSEIKNQMTRKRDIYKRWNSITNHGKRAQKGAERIFKTFRTSPQWLSDPKLPLTIKQIGRMTNSEYETWHENVLKILRIDEDS
jgi:hypothetical protein